MYIFPHLQPRKSLIMVISSVKCLGRKNVLKFEYCHLHKIGTNNYTIDVGYMFFMDMHAPHLETTVRIDSINRLTKRKRRLFDFTSNVCQSLENGQTNILLKAFFANLKETSNLPKKCPLKAVSLMKAFNLKLKIYSSSSILYIKSWI